jgi:hypothetical protein
MQPNAYALAYSIRLAAERDCDPQKYLQAAAEFNALDMPGAADACIERAWHYQELSEQVISLEATE